MRRVLLTRKWVSLTLVAVVLVAAFSWLGSWQWGRSKADPTVDPAHPVVKDPRILVSVARPSSDVDPTLVGLPVLVKGEYDPSGQLLVPDRRQGGVLGSWVLTPLVVTDGVAVPVVRGWVPGTPRASDVPVPTGPVTVTGWYQDSEPDALRPVGELAADQVGLVTTAELLSRWSDDLYHGFVVLDAQVPASDLDPVVPADAQPPAPGIHWQNWGYAWQWWIFAAFVVFFWVRMLRDDLRDDRLDDQAAARPPGSTASVDDTEEESVR